MRKADVLSLAAVETVAELRAKRTEIVALAASEFDTIETTSPMPPERRSERITGGLEMTSRMLESLISLGSVPLVEDQVQWSVRHLPEEGVPVDSVVEGLRAYRRAVERALSDRAAREIVPYIDYMVAAMQPGVDDTYGGEP